MKNNIPTVRVNISEYPYGKVTKALREAAKWVNANNKLINCHPIEGFLPDKIYSKLSTDEADFIEEQTWERREYFWNNPS